MDLQEMINLFCMDVCGGKTNETEASYRNKLTRLTKYFGPGYDPKLITRNDLDRYKYDLQTRKTKQRGSKEIEGGLSPFTIRTALVTARFLFSWAASQGHIPMNPMQYVRIPTPPPPAPKAISKESVLKLLKTAASTGPDWIRVRNVAIIYTLFDTGGRIGGLAEATIHDVDLEAGTFMVTEKGGRQRALFLVSTTIAALREWLSWRTAVKPADMSLFISQKTRKGMERKGFESLLRELSIKAGIFNDESGAREDRTNPHAFRHAFARESILNGADLSEVSALLGHTDTRVTSIYYARWSTKEQNEAHNKYSPVQGFDEVLPEFEKPIPMQVSHPMGYDL